MNFDYKKQENTKEKEIIIEVSIPYEEVLPFLEKTAKKMNKDLKIDGFRPGKIPFDIVKQHVGEANLLQYSMEDIIDKSLSEILKKEDLKLNLTPKVDLIKVVPNNPIEYKVTIYLLPEIELKNWEKLSVKKKESKITDKDVENDLKKLLEYMVEDKEVKRKSKKGDKVLIDFDVLIDGKVIDGGSAKNYELVLGSNSMIPGFEDEIIGMKAGEEKEFKLKFPENYPHKDIAGKEATFKIKVNKVLERVYPEINDELAKKMQYENLAELKETIKKNLEKQAESKLELENVQAILDKLMDKAKFDKIHEAYIEEELMKMLGELKQNIERQGGKYKDYLEHIKKTEDDLKKEMREDAIKRIKTALILDKIAQENNIEVSEEEIDHEIDHYLQHIGQADNPESQKIRENKRFRHYIKQNLVNRKTLEFIKEKILK